MPRENTVQIAPDRTEDQRRTERKKVGLAIRAYEAIPPLVPEVAILNAERARLLTGLSRTHRQKQIASFSFPGTQPNTEYPATCRAPHVGNIGREDCPDPRVNSSDEMNLFSELEKTKQTKM
ncbi:unnamed protein product [Leuciscus chuanchicus]